MKKGTDIALTHQEIKIFHHNLPGKKLPIHSHLEHHLFFPLQGEISVGLEDENITIGPGKMLYLGPQVKHSFESSPDKGERLICHIDNTCWIKATQTKLGPLSYALPANQLVKELIFYLLLNQNSLGRASIITSLIQILWESMQEQNNQTLISSDFLEAKVQDPRLKLCLGEMREKFNQSFSLNDLAKKSGLGVRTMNRLFAQELGMTPKQVQTQYRIGQACELLATGQNTVTEVAFGVGYNSLSQFIQTFRKLTGKLPSDWK